VHVSQTRDDTTNELTSNYIPYGMDLEDFYQSHEWDIMAVPATRNINGDPSSGEFYPDLTFNITLKRKTLFYTCNLIVPCVSISFLTVLTFYLPSECREKISLCISILLALTVFVLLLNDLIPPTSLVVPLIAKYLLFTVVIVTLSNLVSVVVLNVYFRSPSTHRMPNWARHLFLSILPKFLLMKRPPISSSLSASYSLKEFAKAFLRTRTVESGEEDDVGGECDAFHENEEDREVAELKRLLNVPTGPKSLRKRHYRTRQSYQYYLDQMEAVTAVNGVFENLKYEDETNRQEQEWKYMSLVIDRLFLVLFTLTCIIGSCTIILQAPSLYDRAVPIDIIKSRRFKR
jgi:nicotinic acetylcholine receptor